jgi:hypothetical protein
MRLLRLEDDDTFSLVEYFGKDVPPYAILSHTWGADDEEVAFKDLIEGSSQSRNGYRKLIFCGKQARKDGLKFFWVDTCCIDKSSSAELQEALNSMFRWYQMANRCYVYLSDVSTHSVTENSHLFQKSRWFTRGWTLQELIAPVSVEFFSIECDRIGDKLSMMEDIHNVTGIPVQVLQGSPLSSFSTDERMSWAEGRQTKREEDAAYSLLGIFDVYMPLIYGEGRDNAVARLERKINKLGHSQSSTLKLSNSLVDQNSNGMGPFPFLFKDPGLRFVENVDEILPGFKTKVNLTNVSGATGSETNRQLGDQSLLDTLKELIIHAHDNDAKTRPRGDTKTHDDVFDDSYAGPKENTKNESAALVPTSTEHEVNGDFRRKVKSVRQVGIVQNTTKSATNKISPFSLQWTELETYIDGIIHLQRTNSF